MANIVSPEIREPFEKKIKMTLKDCQRWEVKAGPPKSLARSQAKSREYMSEFETDKNLPRWKNFASRFQAVFKREPSKPEDFVWNITDLTRCSITVPDASDVIKVKQIIEKRFPVICVKNTYNPETRVKGSGFRDLKLLIEVEFNDLQLHGAPRLPQKTKFICEIAILCRKWLNNRKNTTISYSIIRAQSLRSLLNDLAKNIKEIKTQDKVIKTNDLAKHNDEIEIIRNG